MISRIAVASTIALLGAFATTSNAFAAKGPDADEVMIWAGIFSIALLIVSFALYGLKIALGLDGWSKPGPLPADYHEPAVPPEGDGHGASGGHGGHH